ncbi:hypothetical protein GEMRC1_001784 [Eukaryota sp. GEM-RC1]
MLQHSLVICPPCYRKSPEEAYRPFLSIRPPLTPFRDASAGLSTFNLTIPDILKSLNKAINTGLYDYNTFDVEHYEYYSRVENGDLNWITPKLLAFAGPVDSQEANLGYSTLTPSHYIPYFKKHNITDVVRLNKKCYNATQFTSNGINHVTLYFVDGGLPPSGYVRQFLNIVDNAPGVVAVHCKAGLGRTGTLIGCWLMKEYFFTGVEVIAYLRLARPGSVIGPQQNFLVDMEKKLHKYGRQQSAASNSPLAPSPAATSNNLVSRQDVSAKSPLSRLSVGRVSDRSILDTPPRLNATGEPSTMKKLERLKL